MNGKDIELSRRRVLGGIVTIGAASAAAGAGTFAYFSDTEESTDNEVSAGTLNLQAGDSDESNYSFAITNLAPKGSESNTVKLQNTGDMTGTLEMSVTVDDSEGATPESETGDVKDISTVIDVGISYGGSTITDSIETTNDTPTLSDLAGSNITLDSSMTSDESNELVITYTLQDVGNDYQGDKSEVDLTFTLNQADSQT